MPAISPVQLNLSGFVPNQWNTVTFGNLPRSATGVILLATVSNVAGTVIAARMTGSSDQWGLSGGTVGGPSTGAQQNTLIAGLNNQAQCDIWLQTTNGVTIWIVGYLDQYYVPFQNAPSLGPLNAAFTNYNVSALVPPGTVAVVISPVINPHAWYARYGTVAAGSTDDFSAGLGGQNTAYTIVGIDPAGNFNAKCSSLPANLILLGYITGGFVWNINAKDVTPTAAGAFQNLPTEPGATAYLLLANSPNATYQYSVNPLIAPFIPSIGASGQLFSGSPPQAEISNTAALLKEVGYFTSAFTIGEQGVSYTPTLQAPVNLAPPSAALALTPAPPNVIVQAAPAPPVATLSLVGAAVQLGLSMVPPPGVILVGGAAPTLSQRSAVFSTPGAGSIVLSSDPGTAVGPPPAVPTTLHAGTVTGNSIQLLWNAINPPATDSNGQLIAAYNVYVNGAIFATISTPVTNGFTVTGLTAGTSYNFQLSAVGASGATSALTAVFQQSTAAATTFAYFIGPNGDDMPGGSLGPGTKAAPWSLQAINNPAARALYAGKAIGLLAGPYTGSTTNGVFTSLFTLMMNSNNGCIFQVQGSAGAPTYIAPCDAGGNYVQLGAFLDCKDLVTGGNCTIEARLIGQDTNIAPNAPAPTVWGGVTIDGLRATNFAHSAVTFTNTTIQIKSPTVVNCEFFGTNTMVSNDNPGAIHADNVLNPVFNNNKIHDLTTLWKSSLVPAIDPTSWANASGSLPNSVGADRCNLVSPWPFDSQADGTGVYTLTFSDGETRRPAATFGSVTLNWLLIIGPPPTNTPNPFTGPLTGNVTTATTISGAFGPYAYNGMIIIGGPNSQNVQIQHNTIYKTGMCIHLKDMLLQGTSDISYNALYPGLMGTDPLAGASDVLYSMDYGGAAAGATLNIHHNLFGSICRNIGDPVIPSNGSRNLGIININQNSFASAAGKGWFSGGSIASNPPVVLLAQPTNRANIGGVPGSNTSNNSFYWVPNALGGQGHGIFQLVQWQNDKYTGNGVPVATAQNLAQFTGFTPVTASTAQLGFHDVAGTSGAQMEGQTVGAYMNCVDLPVSAQDQKFMIAPTYFWTPGTEPFPFSDTSKSLSTSLNLQVPTASGGDVYVNVNHLFLDPNGIGVTLNFDIFNNGGLPGAVTASFDAPSGNYIINNPLGIDQTYVTLAANSNIGSGTTWSGFKFFGGITSSAQFAAALAFLNAQFPGVLTTLDPSQYKLSKVHLNAEFHTQGAASGITLGWSMNNLTVQQTNSALGVVNMRDNLAWNPFGNDAGNGFTVTWGWNDPTNSLPGYGSLRNNIFQPGALWFVLSTAPQSLAQFQASSGQEIGSITLATNPWVTNPTFNADGSPLISSWKITAAAQAAMLAMGDGIVVGALDQNGNVVGGGTVGCSFTGALTMATPAQLPNAQVGVAANFPLVITGGTPPYAVTLTGYSANLRAPNGTAASPTPQNAWTLANSALSCASPSGAEIDYFLVHVADSAVPPATLDTYMSCTVTAAANPLVITTPVVLGNFKQGSLLSIPLNAVGNTGPLSWSLTSQSGPNTYAVSPSGQASGTCSALGTSTINVSVTDGTHTATQSFYVTTNVAVTGAVRPAGNTGAGFFTLGTELYDANGVVYRVRGCNQNNFDKTDSNRYAGLNGTVGINCVRFTMYFKATDAQHKTNFVNQHLNHHRTGFIARFGNISTDSIQTTTVPNSSGMTSTALVKCMLQDWANAFPVWGPIQNSLAGINVCNEWGSGATTQAQWGGLNTPVIQPMASAAGTTINLAASVPGTANPYANTPVAWFAPLTGGPAQMVNISGAGGAAGAFTVTTVETITGSGGTLWGGTIGALRGMGYLCPIMIDSYKFGGNVTGPTALAASILAADPQHNVVFSWHEYGNTGTTPNFATFQANLAGFHNTGCCFVIGEFGFLNDPNGGNITIQQTVQGMEAAGIGGLCWAMDDNDLANGTADDAKWNFCYTQTDSLPGIPAHRTVLGKDYLLTPTYGVLVTGKQATSV